MQGLLPTQCRHAVLGGEILAVAAVVGPPFRWLSSYPFRSTKLSQIVCGGFGGAEDLKASQRHGMAEAVALSGSRFSG